MARLLRRLDSAAGDVMRDDPQEQFPLATRREAASRRF
jgi:hypothetical protein